MPIDMNVETLSDVMGCAVTGLDARTLTADSID